MILLEYHTNLTTQNDRFFCLFRTVTTLKGKIHVCDIESALIWRFQEVEHA